MLRVLLPQDGPIDTRVDRILEVCRKSNQTFIQSHQLNFPTAHIDSSFGADMVVALIASRSVLLLCLLPRTQAQPSCCAWTHHDVHVATLSCAAAAVECA